MEQQLHSLCEQTKSKQNQNQITSHLNWQRNLMFHLAHKQCKMRWDKIKKKEKNGNYIIKGAIASSKDGFTVLHQYH